MQRLEKSFSSLAVCYAFLASFAALLLIYVRLELQASPPDLSNLVGGLIHGSSSIHSIKAAQLLADARSALFALRDRMHTTWLFIGVFAAVWLACLLSMQIERHRREIDFSRREAWWILGFTLSVFVMAVLYGLGTNGILARRFPPVIPFSDYIAVGFLLALPLAAWSRLDRLQEQQEEEDLEREGPAPGRRGFLGLNNDETDARLVDSMSRLEVNPMDLIPSVQVFHPDTPIEPAKAAATRLIETAEAPADATAYESAPPSITTSIEPTITPVSGETARPAGAEIESFRQYLAAMNEGWQQIEAIRGEIDDWFEVRQREAVARLAAHPEMRASSLQKSLFENFPDEKLAAVDAEWAKIHRAALEINRWFGEVPAPGQSKSK